MGHWLDSVQLTDQYVFDAPDRDNVHRNRRVVMHAGRHSERIDFAVANGFVVQLAQTWSFRVTDLQAMAESVRAWGWMIQEARQTTGRLSLALGRFRSRKALM